MDLTQTKLTKAEWTNIEIPVTDREKEVLQLIHDGFDNINIRRNMNQSLLAFVKIDHSPEMEEALYKQYYEKDVEAILADLEKVVPIKTANVADKNQKKKKPTAMKKADLIRIRSVDQKMANGSSHTIYENVLVDLSRRLVKALAAKTVDYTYYLYTLIHVRRATIVLVNTHILAFVDGILGRIEGCETISMLDFVCESPRLIEQNPYLLNYEDMTLFSHQKQLFRLFRSNVSMQEQQEQQQEQSRLVLYIAPTGTGKTLSPIGLAQGHRIIFVCVARHVGLALAKSAISVGKRVAFAFGCETASDIRLHYYAASDYTRNERTGGIGRVNNAMGDKVEIMICDVQSYLTAMHYMLAFSPLKDLITYWDEPTITMDYTDHPLHEVIHRNWTENKISKMVLSCATLPKETEILDTISDFRARFPGAEIHTVSSYDCKKSISLLNKNGRCVLPHLLFRDHLELMRSVVHCEDNLTLLRYFDLGEIARFIEYVHSARTTLVDEAYLADHYFGGGIREITMNSVKIYYLELLKRVDPSKWSSIYDDVVGSQMPKPMGSALTLLKEKKSDAVRKIRSLGSGSEGVNAGASLSRTRSVAQVPMACSSSSSSSSSSTNPLSGVLLTTEDAHTLTDGPTIFLAEDIDKIGRFYIQTSKIPATLLQTITETILNNNRIQGKVEVLEKALEDEVGKEAEKERKMIKENLSSEAKRIMQQINQLRSQVKSAKMEDMYIPNTRPHQNIWVREVDHVANAFVPTIDETAVREVMAVDVDDDRKMLLLLGIGLFDGRETAARLKYSEVMKRLASEQKLFLIIAASDYIYGTNYQFCHGFVGKDLANMTQQKTIQAMGRIGRSHIQQEYTVRFRDDAIVAQLFQPPLENREAEVMSRLFCE